MAMSSFSRHYVKKQKDFLFWRSIYNTGQLHVKVCERGIFSIDGLQKGYVPVCQNGEPKGIGFRPRSGASPP